LVVYPNSGEEWDAEAGTWRIGSGMKSQDFSETMQRALQEVRETWNRRYPKESMPRIIVGGCCRTSPATIAAMRNWIDEYWK